MIKLSREVSRRVFPVFLVGLIGFAAGWFLFALFGHQQITVNNNGARDGAGSYESHSLDGGTTVGIQSTTKVDNIDIAGTTAAHGLVTLFSGITGLPVNACGAGTATTSISTTGTASCSTFFNTAGDHLSSSGSTVRLADIATASFLGRTTAGPGNVETLTATQATALLNAVSITAKGLAPTLPNDATKYLDGTGSYSVPAGTGVSSISAGQSIMVTGTTTPTVALNFPTTTCSAGQAVTSSSSAGTPSCSTFFNTAGDHLSNTGSTVRLADIATASFLGRTSAGPGVVETLTATQATALLDNFTSTLKGLVPLSGGGTTNFLRADGTWTAPPGTQGSFDFGDGSDSTCAFDGVATPVCGATLSGSTYTLTRTVVAQNESVSGGVIILTQGWADYVNGTLSGSGLIHRPGGAGSGTSGGGGATGNNFFGPGGAGGSGGVAGQGSAGGVPAQGLGARDCGSGSTALVTGGNPGNLGLRCGGGSGGGGGGTPTGSSSNASGSMSLQIAATSIHVLSNAISGRSQPADGNSSRMFCGGTGGSGGGLGGGSSGTPGAGGGGGGGGGYVAVIARHSTFTGTISANGGNGAVGANGSGGTAGGGGGGAGGGGGMAIFITGDSGYSLATVTANGGTGGNGGTSVSGPNGGKGGDGGTGVVISTTVGN